MANIDEIKKARAEKILKEYVKMIQNANGTNEEEIVRQILEGDSRIPNGLRKALKTDGTEMQDFLKQYLNEIEKKKASDKKTMYILIQRQLEEYIIARQDIVMTYQDIINKPEEHTEIRKKITNTAKGNDIDQIIDDIDFMKFVNKYTNGLKYLLPSDRPLTYPRMSIPEKHKGRFADFIEIINGKVGATVSEKSAIEEELKQKNLNYPEKTLLEQRRNVIRAKEDKRR